MTGFIYAIECSGRIKLGFSEDPERRFNKVASDAPFPCELLAYWPGSKADELAVQEKFRDVRLHGEWFAATGVLLEFIGQCNEAKPKRQKGTIICGHINLARGEQSRLAAHVGVKPGTVGRWKKVPPEHVRKVAEFTGLPLNKLRPDLYEGLEPAQ